jgi:cytochrome P450
MNTPTTTTALPVNNRQLPIDKGLPILGKLLDFKRDTVAAIEGAWKQHGDLVRLNVGPRWLLLVSHPQLAQDVLIEQKHIFRRPNLINDGTALTPLLGQSVLTTDGDSWLLKRRLMQPIFHRQHIQAMGDKMADAGRSMLARWDAQRAGQVLNLNEEMKLVTLDIINRTMFSTNVLPEVEKIGHTIDVSLQWLTKNAQALVRIPERVPTPGNRSFVNARSTLDGYLYKLIAERRKSSEKRGDLLDMLIDARDEDTGEGMNDEQVRNEVITIYGAGHETTAVALTWAWYALNQNPQVLKKLQHEADTVLQGRPPTMADLPNLPYALQVFEETMRVFPPVPLTVRMAYEPTQLAGYDVPEKQIIAIGIHNIHRHPEFWEQPDAFMPERFAPENKAKLNRNAYMPFLTGPHLCIGNNFALMEGQLLLAMMAQRYEVRVLPNQKVEREVTITMRPKHGLRVTLQRRAA